MILLASVIIASLAFFLALFIIAYFRRKRDIDIFRRIGRHNATDTKSNAKTNETFLQSFYRLIRQTAKPFSSNKIFSGLDLKLKQADIPLSGLEFIVANFIVMGIVGILIYMLTLSYQISAAVALLVPLGIWIAVLMIIQSRKNSFTEQLGDCLVTLANALRAGYSFQQAMELIAKEMQTPISKEFVRASTDIKMGVPIEDALEQMDKRVDNADFTLVVTAVLVQREVGGNLAQILDTISDTIMERIRMKREINALTAQGRLSAIILLLLPFVVGIFMYSVNPDRMSLLFEETSGQIALGVSIVMDIIGFIIIRRIVNIEV